MKKSELIRMVKQEVQKVLSEQVENTRATKSKKKFINPRWFLNETSRRDLLEFDLGLEDLGISIGEVVNQLVNHKDTICKSPNTFKSIVDNLQPHKAAQHLLDDVRKISPELAEVPHLYDLLEVMVALYQKDQRAKTVLKAAIERMELICNIINFKMPKLPKIEFDFFNS
tara:strand:- start:112 stop:621 length:510 start_codon:yes stop_codon:yes gene_type:complete